MCTGEDWKVDSDEDGTKRYPYPTSVADTVMIESDKIFRENMTRAIKCAQEIEKLVYELMVMQDVLNLPISLDTEVEMDDDEKDDSTDSIGVDK